MAEKLPWFPLYVYDWQTDERVIPMDYEAEGLYLALLRHQWIHGSIPDDDAELRAILKPHRPEALATVKGAFCHPIGPGRIAHPKLHALREEQATRSAKMSAGARHRWQQQALTDKRHPQGGLEAPTCQPVVAEQRESRAETATAGGPAAPKSEQRPRLSVKPALSYAQACTIAANNALDRLLAGGYKPLMADVEAETADTWQALGVPLPVATSAISEAVRRYRAKGRDKQPRSLRYFDAAVREAWERSRASNKVKPVTDQPPPRLPETPEERMAEMDERAARRAKAAPAGNLTDVIRTVLPPHQEAA